MTLMRLVRAPPFSPQHNRSKMAQGRHIEDA
jgi:hypothetical protein